MSSIEIQNLFNELNKKRVLQINKMRQTFDICEKWNSARCMVVVVIVDAIHQLSHYIECLCLYLEQSWKIDTETSNLFFLDTLSLKWTLLQKKIMWTWLKFFFWKREKKKLSMRSLYKGIDWIIIKRRFCCKKLNNFKLWVNFGF